MSTIAITINNKKFNLECPPKDHDQLMQLASKVDDEIKKIVRSSEFVSTELALVMLCLKLMSYKQSDVKVAGGLALETSEAHHYSEMEDLSLQLAKLLSKVGKTLV